MDDDAPAWLQPDFDANTLRVAEIRGILVENNIDYPSSAKKAQLVELFNQHVAPRTKRLLGARSRVKASARGIVNAEDELEEEPIAVQPTPRKSRRTRGSVAPSESESDMRASVTPSVASTTTSRTPARSRASMGPPASTVRRNARATESREPTVEQEEVVEEVEETPKPRAKKEPKRKPRKSLSELLEAGSQATEESDEEEVFTKDNPFQARSPPPSMRASKTPDPSRRRTLAEVSPVKKAAPTPGKTRSSLPTNAFTSVKTEERKHAFSIPVSRFQEEDSQLQLQRMKQEVEDEDSVLPGEEFVPEEQEELEQEADYSIVRQPRSSSFAPARSLFAFVLTTIATAFFVWWRKEKLVVGFCGVGGWDGPTGPATLQNFYIPRCEPCPAHAICMPELQVHCQDDYIRVPSPYEFWGLVPLAPTCEPDSEKLRRVAILSDEAVRVLRGRVADIECGNVKLSKGEPKGLTEEDLKRRLYEIKNPKLSDELFNELWRNALEDVKEREEILVENVEVKVPEKKVDGEKESANYTTDQAASAPSTSIQTILTSTSLACLPLTCQLRKYTIRTLWNYIFHIAGTIFLLASAAFYKFSRTKNAETQLRVNALVQTAFQTLSAQARRHADDPHRWPEPFIAIVQLRDQVLQYEFNPKERERLWEYVRKAVELNSNVRVSMREVQGEVMKCWTWVGSRTDEKEVNEGMGRFSGFGGSYGSAGSRPDSFRRMISSPGEERIIA